jgi:GntR family transcriptional regulator / MocR family aminotransferase
MQIAFSEIIGAEPQSIDSASALTQSMITAITKGRLAPGTRLPSVNKIARTVQLNRLTVLKAMDELDIEGWVVKKPRSGIFVSDNLPVDMPQGIGQLEGDRHPLPPLIGPDIIGPRQNFFRLSLNDGYPDHRLFPVQEVARAYSTSFKDHADKASLLYYDVYGQEELREALATYVHQTRNIQCRAENTMVTRGSTLGIYLVAKTICQRGESIAMADPGYRSARQSFEAERFRVVSIQVDDQGMVTDHLREVLRRELVKLIYVTPHHQYPTTVTLSAERRMELLKLAEEYNAYILEDDYDFNFQYDRRPILPMASIDQLHRVIYIGGFSKALSPAIRLGYVIANSAVIREMGKWRRIIDRQGDSIPELAFAKLLHNGVIDKAIRKAIKVYKARRDAAEALFRSELAGKITLYSCQGGLAFWARIDRAPESIGALVDRAHRKQLFMLPPDRLLGYEGQHTRIGFASMTEAEMEEAVAIIRAVW